MLKRHFRSGPKVAFRPLVGEDTLQLSGIRASLIRVRAAAKRNARREVIHLAFVAMATAAASRPTRSGDRQGFGDALSHSRHIMCDGILLHAPRFKARIAWAFTW